MTRETFTEAELNALAKIDADAEAQKKAIFDARAAREGAIPDEQRLVYAAFDRCPCGHGMAYDPSGRLGTDNGSPFRRPNQWECAGILLGVADSKIAHQSPLYFSCWEVKGENQPSANGRTTRGTIVPQVVS